MQQLPELDLDFSLAMHNRTGKYFIGKDILGTPGIAVGRTYYWWRAMSAPPSGLARQIMGRLQLWQVEARTRGRLSALVPARRPRRPLLHLDPFTVPTTRLRRCDVVLCHDVGPVTHPALFEKRIAAVYRHIYHDIARIGPHLVFVSRATQAAFVRLYPQARPASARVIYPAIRTDIAAGPASAVAAVDGRFLLTVGSLGDRKNQARCIRAYARSGLSGQGVAYVLCGAHEPGHEAVTALAARTPGVIVLDYVGDAELNWLYGAADGFVLASLLEGFGMPVSEAIARGLVPLISRDSVLHEVAGQGAVAVDPLDEADIAAGMVRLATMTAAERAERLATMRAANARFSLAEFQRQWRAAFADFAADAAAAPPG